MKLINRGGIAAMLVVGSALVAVGCGGSDSSATTAAKDAAALDLVPKDALGYIVVDADVNGDGWKQFDKLAGAFDDGFDGVGDEIAQTADDENSDWAKDIDPWLGDTAGLALISVDASEAVTDATGGDMAPDDSSSSGDDVEAMVWFDLEDRAKFEDFLKSRADSDYKKGSKVGDFDTWINAEDDEYFGVSDDFAFFTDSKARLKTRAEFDGDSITDADGIGDVIDEAGDDALATLVVSGEGVRNLVKDTPEFKSLGLDEQLKDFNGMAFTFGSEDEGLRLHGFVSADGEATMKNEEPAVFKDLPGSTLLAVGANDLGGALKTGIDGAGKENAQVQQAAGAISGVLGVDIDDLAKAFEGEFAFAMGADDAGLGALAGGVVGAAMGGGLESIDPATLSKAASATIAFEEKGSASETLDKVVSAVGGFAGVTAAPTAGTAGDFATKTWDVSGLPLTTAASDKVAAVSIGADVFSTWGTDSLGDNADFSAAWKAAGAPDKTASTFWLDFGRVAKLASLKSKEGVTPRGWVGWIEADGASAKLDLFMHIESK